MSIRILITDSMEAAAQDKLRADGYELVTQHYEPDELGPALREYDAVVIRSATKIRVPQIDAAKGSRLKLIVRAGVGVDNIDVEYAEAAGIRVMNTPHSSSNAVAELAIGLLFSCARFISAAGVTMHENRWEKKAFSKGFEIEGKTMGIIGYGRIGSLVSKKAQALGMKVLTVVHNTKPADAESDSFRIVTMDELLAQSDVITLCAPAVSTPFVRKESIDKMKDGVVIINVSRGANVVEPDLVEALDSGKVIAAGLDVFVGEKNPYWALAAHPHVSATPHLGASTEEAQAKIGVELVDVIEGFFA